MKRLFLVACVKTKRNEAAPAAELYTSALFRKSRRFVERTGYPWFILDAQYGLLPPDKIIEPYECTLSNMGTADRRAWAERTCGLMEAELPDAEEVVILAGKNYWEYLLPWLRTRFRKVDKPMEGLKIGQQLSWLGNLENAEPFRS